jgi:hypothetical protein
MADLAGKLQLKPGQSVAFVNAPEDVALELGGHPVAEDPDQADAVIVFCPDRAGFDRLRDQLVPPARRDALTWIAYPKAGQLGTDLTRDVVAQLAQAQGIQPVRQVSVDDVWSALRLRPA